MFLMQKVRTQIRRHYWAGWSESSMVADNVTILKCSPTQSWTRKKKRRLLRKRCIIFCFVCKLLSEKRLFGSTDSNVSKLQTCFDWACSWEILADATSSPGLSATLLKNKSIEPDSPLGPEHVNITLYRSTGRLFMAATWHNDSCCF